MTGRYISRVPLGRGFSALWSANALSNLADGVAFVSMPLLAASMTDDPRVVAGLATLYALVRLLVALPIGVWVDRLDRRTLIVAANLLRGAGLLGLAMTIHFGVSSLGRVAKEGWRLPRLVSDQSVQRDMHRLRVERAAKP